MSLKKLFNIDYFIQNIKKSKLAVLLFLSVVPLFTSLLIITNGESLIKGGFEALGGFNIFFMYITPFILSLSLFGYVFRRKSSDFMGSMPISRKSIYTTNTLGGILLILFMQLITLLCTFLLFAVSKGSIFPALVWDIFVFQTISYIFMFSVCNLAMSVSGNWITQIVVVMLILFIIPSSVLFFNLNHIIEYNLTDGEYVYDMHVRLHRYFHFTAPSYLTNGMYMFDAISIVKMLVLSAIYITIGYFAFSRKKLENAGESFENPNIHFIVKGLTLIPFGMILVFLINEETWEGILFLVAIVAVYFLIYDMLTNKKMKFWLNMGVMFASLVMLFGVYRILYEFGNERERHIDLSDIKSYRIATLYNQDFYPYDLEFNNMDLLKKIISNRNDNEKWYYELDLDVTLKDGSKATLSISDVEPSSIKELLLKQAVRAIPNNGILVFRDVSFSQKQIDSIVEELNQYIGQNGVEAFYERISNSNSQYMTLYLFEHHNVISIHIPFDFTDHLFEMVTQFINQDTYQMVSKNSYRDYNLFINSEELRKRDGGKGYYRIKAPKELLEFVLSEEGKACNNQENYISFQIDNHYYYTNQVDEVIEIMLKQDLTKLVEDGDWYYYDKYVYPTEEFEVETTFEEDTEIFPLDGEEVILGDEESLNDAIVEEPVLESL